MAHKVNSVFSAVATGWALLAPSERTRLVILSIAQVFVRLFDMAAVAIVVPTIMVLIQQDTSQSQRILQFIHDAVPNIGTATALHLCILGVVLLLLVATVGAIMCQYAASKLALASQARLIGELLTGVITGPLTWIKRQSSATIVRMLCNDVAALARAFIETVPSGIGSLSTIIFGTALILYNTPFAGLATVVVFGSIAVAIFRYTRIRIGYFSGLQRTALNQLAVGLSQATDGVKDIKVSGRENYFIERCLRQARLYGNATVFTRLWTAIGPGAMLFLTQISLLSVALVLWWTNTNQGDVAARLALMLLVASRMVPAFSRIGVEIGRLATAEPFMRGLSDLRQELSVLSEKMKSIKRTEQIPDDWSTITFEGVSFGYPGANIPALNNVSVQLNRGGSYGICGPSGAGKSTFVDLMLGLLDPSAGSLRVGPVALSQAILRGWHKRIGFVPQEPFIADDTLRANVAFGIARGQIDDQWVIDCLKAVQLEEFLATCPDGLDTTLGEKGALISGGQRQRIAIARALYRRPDVVIFDEATSALDSINERAIQDVIKNLHGSVTVITIAHRFTTIRNCDEILVLEAGRLVARGTYDRLILENDLFRELAATTKVESQPAQSEPISLP